MQNEPNFMRFLAPKPLFAKKQTQNEPNQTQSNPIHWIAKMNLCPVLTRCYENKRQIEQNEFKPNFYLLKTESKADEPNLLQRKDRRRPDDKRQGTQQGAVEPRDKKNNYLYVASD